LYYTNNNNNNNPIHKAPMALASEALAAVSHMCQSKALWKKHSMHSGMDHTVLTANYTLPAATS